MYSFVQKPRLRELQILAIFLIKRVKTLLFGAKVYIVPSYNVV